MKKDQYWLYGKHSVLAALSNKRRQIHEILITDKALTSLDSSLLKEYKIVTAGYINQILNGDFNHQGMAARVSKLAQLTLKDLVKSINGSSTIIALDRVTDPQNLGAILRVAAAFNIDALILPKASSAHETAVVAKISSGAIEIVPIIEVSNLVNALTMLQKWQYWVAILDHRAHSKLDEIKQFDRTCLVLGSEEKGVRRLVRSAADISVKIPISPNVESLNVSHAAAITAYILTG